MMDQEMQTSEGAGEEQETAAPEAEGSAKKEEASKEEEELNTRYLRLAADFQNFRKRVEKEKGDIYAYANEKIVVELLDVIDNFERALEHSSENESFCRRHEHDLQTVQGGYWSEAE